MNRFKLETPIGSLRICEKQGLVVAVEFDQPDKELELKIRSKSVDQLRAYFAGERCELDLSISLSGTKFQLSVWKAISEIPFGKTVTYKQLAESVGKPKAVRAVANACGANPLPIIIPCHRVVASNGMGGYSGGLWRKEWLLAHEAKMV